MSRGGRRRKGKRGRRGPGTPESQRGIKQEPAEPRDQQQHSGGRRRSHGRAAARETSVLDSMSSLPTSLKTLPPDGTDLDELIGALQSEYGVPATPQEYRLIIKVPAPEEHTDPSLEVKPPAPSPQNAEPRPETEVEGEGPPVRLRAGRRRRRGRRRPGGTTAMEEDLDGAGGDDLDTADDSGDADPEDAGS
jgi:hypothetical protein